MQKLEKLKEVLKREHTQLYEIADDKSPELESIDIPSNNFFTFEEALWMSYFQDLLNNDDSMAPSSFKGLYNVLMVDDVLD